MLTTLLLTLALQPAAGITWTPALESALAQAAVEKKVVFLAVNMDGEAANDRMVKRVYTEKGVVAQAALTLNVIASVNEHSPKGKPCPRFAGVECMEHRRADVLAREKILKPDAQGFVVAPQHVFLGPDGKVILSVPYEVDASELVWCFATAQAKAFPDAKHPLPAGARMPRRVIHGGVYDPSKNEAGAAPPTKAEVEQIIEELRRGVDPAVHMAKLLRLVLSDEPAAVEFVEQELKSNGASQGRAAGPAGGGRGGGGGGAGGRGGDGRQRHARILKAIGAFGPQVYTPLVLPFLGHDDPQLRSEAAVALEQLGNPAALRELQSAFAKEEDAQVKSRLARALGSSGASDSRIHALLQKELKGEKSASGRAARIVALGYSTDDAAVDTLLEGLLAGPSPADAEAAAAAVALSRRERWIAVLEAALPAADAERKKSCEQALAVLRSQELGPLASWIAGLTGDDLERERIFGRQR